MFAGAARPTASEGWASKQSGDVALQERLWKVSEELTGVTFPV